MKITQGSTVIEFTPQEIKALVRAMDLATGALGVISPGEEDQPIWDIWNTLTDAFPGDSDD